MFGRNIHLLEPLSCSCSIAGMSQCEKAVSIMCQENFWQVQSGEQRGIGPHITLKFLTHVWVPYISTVAGIMSCSWGELYLGGVMTVNRAKSLLLMWMSFFSFLHSYLFHYISEDRVIYLCITDDVSQHLHISFQHDLTINLWLTSSSSVPRYVYVL